MTKEQFVNKVKELYAQNEEILDNRIEKILRSGCIDLTNYEDNFVLPKIFMCAFAKELQWQWKPSNKEYQQTSDNMANFM